MLTTLLFLQPFLPAGGGREGDGTNTYSSGGKDENTVVLEQRRGRRLRPLTIFGANRLRRKLWVAWGGL